MEKPLAQLEAFVPHGSMKLLCPYFRQYPIHLTLTRARRTVFGNYRPPAKRGGAHRVSVNADLNPYAFLVTLTHELAHLKAFVDYGPHIKPHGPEWKGTFKTVLQPFVAGGFFPHPIAMALEKYLQNPAASSCTDSDLYKALRAFDAPKEQPTTLVAAMPEGTLFETPEGRQFVRLKKLRTRIQCRETGTGKTYLFAAVAEGIVSQKAP